MSLHFEEEKAQPRYFQMKVFHLSHNSETAAGKGEVGKVWIEGRLGRRQGEEEKGREG